MSVRAKFTVTKVECIQFKRQKDMSLDHRPDNIETVEMRTIILSPVYGNNNPDHENSKFWRASPSGEIRLGTVNPEAWSHFELGKSYYVDFTEAPE